MENIPVWGDHEEKTLVQIRTCASTADRVALMADGHRLRQQGCSSRYAGRRAAREDRHHHGRCVGGP
jgi:hypothetical protein